MAQIWSNGKYKAPLHRVLTHRDKERYSAPFFYNPSYDSLIEPVVDSPKDAAYHPVLWGYFRAVRFAGDLTDLGVEIQIEAFLKKKRREQQQHGKQEILPPGNSSNENKQDDEDEDDDISGHRRKQEIFSKLADFHVPFSVEKYRQLLIGG